MVNANYNYYDEGESGVEARLRQIREEIQIAEISAMWKVDAAIRVQEYTERKQRERTRAKAELNYTTVKALTENIYKHIRAKSYPTAEKLLFAAVCTGQLIDSHFDHTRNGLFYIPKLKRGN